MAKTVAKLTPVFDAVVASGRVIDPKNGVHDLRDIGIRKGRIAAVAPKLAAGNAKIIDANGLVLTPGLIDTHAHVYEHVSGVCARDRTRRRIGDCARLLADGLCDR